MGVSQRVDRKEVAKDLGLLGLRFARADQKSCPDNSRK